MLEHSGVAGGVHSWRASQFLNRKSRVFGKNQLARNEPAVVLGFDAGVLLECTAVFDGGWQRFHSRESLKLHAETLCGFVEFAHLTRIAGCEIDLRHGLGAGLVSRADHKGHARGYLMLRSFYLLLAVGTLLVSGCDVSPGKNRPTTSPLTNGLLYVATPSSILRFSNALSATGNVTPAATISGGATLLSSPQHLLIDVVTDRLFVANQGGASILLFQNASTITGNTTPNAIITSSSMSAPVDIALDTGFNNFLYVADGRSEERRV